jgi:probable F420-dependent oxidoreductase
VRLCVSLSPARPDGDPGRVLRVARAVERLGFDGVSMSGQVLDFPEGSSLDPMVLLAAVAGATERVRLLTSVLVLPVHPPLLLANQAATLDVLSDGRFTLGVGVGAGGAEYAAVGVATADRGRRADEYLDALRALWTQRPAGFAGRFTCFQDALLGTEPHTPGGPPIWVGGRSSAALRRALRCAEAWIGVGVEAQDIPRVRARLAHLAGDTGRQPATLELNSVYFVIPAGFTGTGFLEGRPLGGSSATPARLVEDLGRLGEAGLGWADLIVPVAPDRLLDAVHWLAAEVLPQLGVRPDEPRKDGEDPATRPD